MGESAGGGKSEKATKWYGEILKSLVRHLGAGELCSDVSGFDLEKVRHYLHFTSSQVAAQHHKYSPMDRLHGE